MRSINIRFLILIAAFLLTYLLIWEMTAEITRLRLDVQFLHTTPR